MTIAVMCEKCGEKIPFELEGVDSTPLYEMCDNCKISYKLTIRKMEL